MPESPAAQQAVAAVAQQLVSIETWLPFWRRTPCFSVEGQRCWAQLNRSDTLDEFLEAYPSVKRHQAVELLQLAEGIVEGSARSPR
jgi:hypothetical protein